MKRRSLLLAGLLAIYAFTPGPGHAASADLQAYFQAKEQALFDAITSGDKTLWDKTMDAACVITTEDGEVQDKTKFLADVAPLPRGFVGRGTIRDLTVNDLGGAAVVHYLIDETEDIFDQQLKTKYVETDIYQRAGSEWKMVAMQVTVVPRDMEPIAVDHSSWKDLAGSYHFPGNDKVRFQVFVKGEHLMGGKDEKSAKELIPLSPLVYHQSGSIHLYIFVRTSGGVNEVREIHKYNEVRMQRSSGSP